ncbi:hypothetical protein MMC18_000564 [Xylographa bjoerkii]|nr:hypothetical protein [Xylographa bjoerkii]
MDYPINPNARAESTYAGPSHSPSIFAKATFPPIHIPYTSSKPGIIDGFRPIHPHHFYPSLFSPPSADLPLHPGTDTTLADLYHAAVSAAQKWTLHQQAWSAASKDALARSPPTPYRACGQETMHPHHFYPWLFDEPTPHLPLYVRTSDTLAPLYEDALRAANGWVPARQQWLGVEAQRREAREQEVSAWDGLEEAAEADGLWEQRRLDEERESDYAALEEELAREWKRLDEEAARVGS